MPEEYIRGIKSAALPVNVSGGKYDMTNAALRRSVSVKQSCAMGRRGSVSRMFLNAAVIVSKRSLERSPKIPPAIPVATAL